MALADQLIELAKSYYAAEVDHAIDGNDQAAAAGNTSLPREMRAALYDVAIAEIDKAAADAKRIYQLTEIANSANDDQARDALHAARDVYQPMSCVGRIANYVQQADQWRTRRAVLFLSTNPTPFLPPDIGAPPGPPVAPPPDPATQVGILAVGAGLAYAAWYFLLRRR